MGKKECQARWYKKHAEREKKRFKDRYRKNKEKHAIVVKNWQSKNKSRIEAARKIYNAENKEKINARQRLYYSKNTEKMRSQGRANYKKQTFKINIRRYENRKLKRLILELESDEERFYQFYENLYREEEKRIQKNIKINMNWLKSKPNKINRKNPLNHPWNFIHFAHPVSKQYKVNLCIQKALE